MSEFNALSNWLSSKHNMQILSKKPFISFRVENVHLDTSIGILQDRSIEWLLKAYNKINNPSMVKRLVSISNLMEIFHIYIFRHSCCAQQVKSSISHMKALPVMKPEFFSIMYKRTNLDLWSTITSAQY
jgi:hypothetical protein